MISLNEKGGQKIIAKYSKGVSAPISRAVMRLTLFMERTARDNITKSVYQRSVPWVRSGKARQSIVGKQESPLSGRVTMGVKYGKFIEFGTKPHVITARGRSLVAKIGGKKVFLGKRVNHPGSKAYPFWNPAIKATKKQVPIELKKQINQALK